MRETPYMVALIAVVEGDRRLALRLRQELRRRRCRVRMAHSCVRARAMLAREVPHALYVSEQLQRLSGGDLLVALDRDERLTELPVLVRVSHQDSVFARTLRRGGFLTATAPIDVAQVAARLERMAVGEEGTLRALMLRTYALRERTRRNLEKVAATVARGTELLAKSGERG